MAELNFYFSLPNSSLFFFNECSLVLKFKRNFKKRGFAALRTPNKD